MRALLRRLLRLERRVSSRPAPRTEWVVCERCDQLVENACWHRHCPLTRSSA